MPLADKSRVELLARVIADCSADSYTELAPKDDFNPQPLLYFGDPSTAEFATFGMNPAADELSLGRWPLKPELTVEDLDCRLVNYFKNDKIPPSKWFDGYETPENGCAKRALNILGHSYRSDTIHLDFSPRATIPRSTIAGRVRRKEIGIGQYQSFVEKLRKLIASDLPYFVSALTICRQVRAAIMAGSIANDARRDYLYQVLQMHLPAPYSLKLRLLLENRKYGATALYDLVGPQLNIPVLFVSASPSSSDRGAKLADEVKRNLSALKQAGF